MVGVANMTLMLTLIKSPTPERLFFLLLTVVALSLIPMYPIWGSLGYLTLWIALLQAPHVPASDMTITNAAFFFFLAAFLPLRVAIILALVVPAALIIPAGPLPDAVSQLFLAACTLLPGSILRHTETSLREEVSTATEKLKSIRSEIAREMHDLVAYSMSQTALRAQRAAAAPSYPGAAGYPGDGGNPSALAPKPSIIPLRPLSIGEILGGAFESLRANPKAMFVPSLAVMTIVGLISAAGSVYSLNRLGTTSLYSSSGQPSDADVQKQLSSLLELYAQSAISSILTMLASSILTGLLIVTVSRTILGRKASLGDVWQRTKPRVWALIGQAVIIQLILSAVMAAAIGIWVAVVFALGVPGMVEGSSRQGAAATVLLAFLGLFILIVLVGLGVFALYCKLCLAPAALILENVGVFEGISRSWTLTRGNFWRIVGIQLLSVIIIVFATGIATTPVSFLAGILAATVPSVETLTLAFSVLLGTIVTAATLPFDSAVRALIYTDLRMRSEGLDVELRRAAGV